MQFGYTVNFLAHKLGSDSAADELAKSRSETRGSGGFFSRSQDAAEIPVLEDLGRLQFVGSSLFEGALQKKIPAEWKDGDDAGAGWLSGRISPWRR